jgi:hypothetical protein
MIVTVIGLMARSSIHKFIADVLPLVEAVVCLKLDIVTLSITLREVGFTVKEESNVFAI